MKTIKHYTAALLTLAVALTLIIANGAFAAQQSTKSGPFAGPKANTGYVTMSKENGKTTLTLSDDFVVPDTPDPHWRVIDSKGTVYDLQRLKIKEDRYNRSITLPAYIKDVTKVVIWCAWAEANLGEASFKSPNS
jgi:hypothetical protein